MCRARGRVQGQVVPDEIAVLIVSPVTVLVAAAGESDGPIVALILGDHDPHSGRLLVRRKDWVPVGQDA